MNYQVRLAAAIAAVAGLGMPSLAAAQAVLQFNPNTPQISGVGGNVVVPITITGDGVVQNANGTIEYDTVNLNATVAAQPGGGCAVNDAFSGTRGRITVSSQNFSGNPLPASASTLCNVTFTHTGAVAGDFDYDWFSTNANGSSIPPVAGADPNETPEPGAVSFVRVLLGPQAGPAITYNPATNAAVGTITFPAATSIGGTTTFDITTVIGAGGQNGGETTVGACTTSGGVSFTDGTETCTHGGACVDGNLTLQCVSTAANQTGTVSCTETTDAELTAGGGQTTTATRTWGFTCPAANVAPTINSTTPAYGAAGGAAEISFAQVGVGQPSSQVVNVAASGGSGSGTASYTCSASAGFSVTGSPVNFAGTQTAGSFTATCDAAPAVGAGATTGTLTCTEIDADSAGPAGTTRTYDLSCPEGVPRSAPTVTYGMAPTFNTGATVGATATSTANFTADITGGQDDGAGGPESAAVSCSVTSGPFALGAGTASATGITPATAGNSATEINVALTCTTPANTAAAGVLTCNYIPTVDGVAGAAVPTAFDLSCPPAPVNLSSNPAPGTISLSGVPGATVGGSIVFSNSGSDAAMTCTATAGTANVQITSNPATVGANSSATLAYTCTAAAPGATATGSIQCDTTDPDDFDVVTYNITCNGLVSAPIPAISDFGKVLMVVLVIGLGLVGLGARRL